jgi:uncharacterized protein
MQPLTINIPQEKLIPNSQITQGRFLGQGGYGRVFEAQWNGDTVAVKQLMVEKMNQQAQTEFEQEITLHMKLSHPRVIRLYGIIAEAGQPYGMVMEYAAKGSLFSLLEATKQSQLSWDDRKKIAGDTISALQYLHHNDIIHRDLKSLNVLLDEKFHALLADFGLSKVRSQTSSQSKVQVKGTIQFLAPELLAGFRPKYDSKTDVYAYGMMLWELATHEIPYGDTNSDLIRSLVKEGQREEFPDETHTPQEYQQLTQLCWAQKPDERPTVENIQKLLDKMEFGKSKPQTSQSALPDPMRNNGGYDLKSNVQPEQNSNRYALKTETFTPKSQKSGQGYVLESQTVRPQSNSSQGRYTLKTETMLPKPQSSIKSNVQQNNSEALYILALQHINQSQYSKAVPLLEEAANQGHASAQNWLGFCYKNGQGITQDDAKAVKYYRLAADHGLADAQFNLGVCYSGKGVTQDHAQAVKYFRLAADQGDASAQYNLGLCYKKGQGITQDYAQAVKYYHLAADHGLAAAQYNLGVCYYKGHGVIQDYAKAVKYFRLATDQELAAARNDLGLCYKIGHGVIQDDAKAVKYFRLAADQGYAAAQDHLGHCYQNGESVTKDYTQAVKYYRLAADQGLASAQYNLGFCYLNGHDVTKDYTQAVIYFRLAADQGLASAQYNLGVCYYKGHGVIQDDAKAVKYFRLAADQGYAAAQDHLGHCYQNGESVTKDCTQAVKYYRLAANQGLASAQYNLGFCYQNGHGITQNYAQAVIYFRLAADQGDSNAISTLRGLTKIVLPQPQSSIKPNVQQNNSEALFPQALRYINQSHYSKAVPLLNEAAKQGNAKAQNWLGRFYEKGHGVTKDYTQAVKYYRLAAAQGLDSAQYNLGFCYQNGLGIKKDKKQAKHYYQLAANQGDSDAISALYELSDK